MLKIKIRFLLFLNWYFPLRTEKYSSQLPIEWYSLHSHKTWEFMCGFPHINFKILWKRICARIFIVATYKFFTVLVTHDGYPWKFASCGERYSSTKPQCILGSMEMPRGSNLCAVKIKTCMSYVSSICYSACSCADVIWYAIAVDTKWENMHYGTKSVWEMRHLCRCFDEQSIQGGNIKQAKVKVSQPTRSCIVKCIHDLFWISHYSLHNVSYCSLTQTFFLMPPVFIIWQ